MVVDRGGEVDNTFEYHGRELYYTIDTNGMISIHPVNLPILDDLAQDIGVSIPSLGTNQLVQALENISWDMQKLGSMESPDQIESYIQQTINGVISDLLEGSPVDENQQELLRHDVEFYTFAEQLHNANDAINNS